MIGLKRIARALATVGASPMILQFWLMGWVVGRDRALQNSSQALSLIPGLIGQYVRRAFLSHAIEHCDPSSTVEFGTLFSKARSEVGGERLHRPDVPHRPGRASAAIP